MSVSVSVSEFLWLNCELIYIKIIAENSFLKQNKLSRRAYFKFCVDYVS